MQFKEEIKSALEKALSDLNISDVDIKLEHPADPQFGDYSTNVAMVAAKSIGKNPRELAEKIVDLLNTKYNIQNTSSITVEGPGFINFYLSEAALSKELQLALEKGDRYGSSDLGTNKTLVIDYSAPNIAKRFGIGHLRSTIIGQAIYNLYKTLGWTTLGDNHLGDWGTQFGVLLYQVTTKNIDPADLNIELLEKLYVEFHQAEKENESLRDEARLWFKKLEDGDPRALELWNVMKDISLEEFNRIYDLLGVKLDYAYGESFYQDKMEAVVEEAKSKGFAKESQGALIFEFPNEELPPAILYKSDEATTYFTRDLATVRFRLDTWNPDLIVYEVGDEQSLHFKQVFRAVELLGWAKSEQFIHVNHGLYLSPDGKKMRTRSGDTVKLEDVLSEAVERAHKLASVSELKTSNSQLTTQETDKVAAQVGIGSVKYFDLSHHPASNIIFDWDKVFQMDGNSAPYLQYTYARTKSILSKSNMLNTKYEILSLSNVAINQEEMGLLRTIYRYPEIIEEAALTYSPNLVCSYLFDLASKYNGFYNRHRILEADDPTFRLGLTQVVGNILKSGLNILGIAAPERM